MSFIKINISNDNGPKFFLIMLYYIIAPFTQVSRLNYALKL